MADRIDIISVSVSTADYSLHAAAIHKSGKNGSDFISHYHQEGAEKKQCVLSVSHTPPFLPE